MPIDFQGKELQYVIELHHRVEKANSFSEKYRMLWSERGLEIGNLTAQLDSALDEVGRLERSNQTAHKLEVDAQQRYEAEKIEHEKTKQQLADLKNHMATKVLEGLDNGKLKFADLSVQAYY